VWTDVTTLCFATSAATLAVAAIGYVVDKFVTPWPLTGLLLVVAAFFFAQGLWHLVGQAFEKAQPAGELAEGHRTAARRSFDSASALGHSEFHREAPAVETSGRDQQFVRA